MTRRRPWLESTGVPPPEGSQVPHDAPPPDYDDGPSGWVRRSEPLPPHARAHTCLPPVAPRTYRVTPIGSWPRHLGPPPDVREEDAPVGEAGDLWRCGCGRLWQVHESPYGLVPGGRFCRLRWQPASLWTRLRYGSRPAQA